MPYVEDKRSDEDDSFDLKYRKSFEKKISSKPFNQQVLMRRTLGSGLTIVQRLSRVDFSDLALSLYVYCKDMEMFEFTHEYEKQIELAKANPERFLSQLYKFYTQISVRIKKENLYRDYFELLAFCVEYNERLNVQDVSREASYLVMDAYIDLLMENLEHIRPDKFNPNQVIAGLKTDGSMITITDPFPLTDVIATEIEKAFVWDRKKGTDLPATVSRIIRENNYDIKALSDIFLLQERSRMYSNNIYFMIPYINEYTFDIVPKRPVRVDVSYSFPVSSISNDDLVDRLMRRRRTLPVNGAMVKISGVECIQGILFKEIIYKDSICLLYKVSNLYGDFSGYYNTRTGFLYSIFVDTNHSEVGTQLKNFVLWVYCSIVRDDEDTSLNNFAAMFKGIGESAKMEMFSIGGKLRNTYDEDSNQSKNDGEGRERHPRRFDKEKCEIVQRTLGGYTRRLPEGMQASDRAKKLAEYYGFELGSNETYVQPFIKQVYRLSGKKQE